MTNALEKFGLLQQEDVQMLTRVLEVIDSDQSPTDLRSRMYFLTPKGKNLLKRVTKAIKGGRG